MNARGNQISTWQSGALPETLFLQAHYRDLHFQPHFHEDYAIGIIEDGCQAFAYDARKRLDLPRGTVCLISPGTVHEGWVGATGGWRYRMFYPRAALVEETAEDIFGTSHISFHAPGVDDPELHAILLRLHQLSGQSQGGHLECETLFIGAIRMALERHATLRITTGTQLHSAALGTAREYMEDKYSDPITLADLKHVTGLSKFHFLRQFKAAHGLPPHAYLAQIRVNRAAKLILAGGSLADTAAMVGFSDQAHMTHAFRRSLGYTPGAMKSARA